MAQFFGDNVFDPLAKLNEYSGSVDAVWANFARFSYIDSLPDMMSYEEFIEFVELRRRYVV